MSKRDPAVRQGAVAYADLHTGRERRPGIDYRAGLARRVIEVGFTAAKGFLWWCYTASP